MLLLHFQTNDLELYEPYQLSTRSSVLFPSPPIYVGEVGTNANVCPRVFGRVVCVLHFLGSDCVYCISVAFFIGLQGHYNTFQTIPLNPKGWFPRHRSSLD